MISKRISLCPSPIHLLYDSKSSSNLYHTNKWTWPIAYKYISPNNITRGQLPIGHNTMWKAYFLMISGDATWISPWTGNYPCRGLLVSSKMGVKTGSIESSIRIYQTVRRWTWGDTIWYNSSLFSATVVLRRANFHSTFQAHSWNPWVQIDPCAGHNGPDPFVGQCDSNLCQTDPEIYQTDA